MARSNNSRRGSKRGNRNMSPAPKKIGNSSKVGCTFCNPKLSIRVTNKKSIVEENQSVQKEKCKIII